MSVAWRLEEIVDSKGSKVGGLHQSNPELPAVYSGRRRGSSSGASARGSPREAVFSLAWSDEDSSAAVLDRLLRRTPPSSPGATLRGSGGWLHSSDPSSSLSHLLEQKFDEIRQHRQASQGSEPPADLHGLPAAEAVPAVQPRRRKKHRQAEALAALAALHDTEPRPEPTSPLPSQRLKKLFRIKKPAEAAHSGPSGSSSSSSSPWMPPKSAAKPPKTVHIPPSSATRPDAAEHGASFESKTRKIPTKKEKKAKKSKSGLAKPSGAEENASTHSTVTRLGLFRSGSVGRSAAMPQRWMDDGDLDHLPPALVYGARAPRGSWSLRRRFSSLSRRKVSVQDLFEPKRAPSPSAGVPLSVNSTSMSALSTSVLTADSAPPFPCSFGLMDFPSEVLLTIFSYLSPADLRALAQVNGRAKQLSEDDGLWRSVCDRSWPLLQDRRVRPMAKPRARHPLDWKHVYMEQRMLDATWLRPAFRPLVEPLQGSHHSAVTGVHMAHGLLASASVDRMVRLWAADSRKPGPILRHPSAIHAVAVCSATVVVSATEDGTLCLWDSHSSDFQSTPLVHSNSILPNHSGNSSSSSYVNSSALHLTMANSGNASSAGDGVGVVSSSSSAPSTVYSRPVRILGGHTAEVLCIRCVEGREEHLLWSGGADGTLRLWDLRMAQGQARVLSGHQGHVTSVHALPSGSEVVSGSSHGVSEVRVWDVGSGRTRLNLRSCGGDALPYGHVYAVAAAEERIAAATRDGSVRVWASVSGKRVAEWQAHGRPALALQIDHGKWLTASADHSVRIWNPSDCSLARELTFPAPLLSLCMDDSRFLVGAADGSVRLVSFDQGSSDPLPPSVSASTSMLPAPPRKPDRSSFCKVQ